MQDESDKCTKKFLKLVEEKLGDTSTVPKAAITKYCRMLTIYCDTDGKVSDSFVKSMEKCINEIIEVEGLKEILDACNTCPDA